MAKRTTTKATKATRRRSLPSTTTAQASPGPPASKQAVPVPRRDLPPLTTATLAEQGEAKVLESERRRARLVAREPVEDQVVEPERTGPVERAAVPPRDDGGRGFLKREELTPLRPETKAQEAARYPGRMAAWQEKQAIFEGRKGHEQEDAEHLRLCEVRRPGRDCPHPSHVDARRELRSETTRDRRHLGSCDLEDPECLDDSHLLPPHPLDVALEYCCASRCFLRRDVRYLTECVFVPVQVRDERQAKLRRRGRLAFGPGLGGRPGEASVIVTAYLSESTEALRTLTRNIYDPAMVPLREE